MEWPGFEYAGFALGSHPMQPYGYERLFHHS